MKVISIVGMAGCGKSEVAAIFREHGFASVRFGDATDDEVRRIGLELNEQNERRVRETFREKYGMAAYAQLNLPRIDAALAKSDVVVDGLYSWEEYKFLMERYGEDFRVLAVYASLKTRHDRLRHRKIRPLTHEEAKTRDYSEIEKLNKGGPIAMADYTVINEKSLSDLKKQVERVIGEINER
jgi:dephospho-CoA kinase